MRFRLLPTAIHRDHPDSPAPPAQPLTSIVVSGEEGAGPLAIDAGSLGLVGDPVDMNRIKDVLLTHSHIDHVATLPMWIESCLSEGRAPVRVHAPEPTVEALRDHLFNGVLFPDFEGIHDDKGRPLMEWGVVPTDRDFSLSGFTIEAIPCSHTVPTFGYVVEDGTSSVVFAADSGPNPDLWVTVASRPQIKAVVLECSFPDELTALATGSGHLTPSMLADELRGAPKDVQIFVAHLKPAHRHRLARAIKALRDPRVQLLVPGVEVEV